MKIIRIGREMKFDLKFDSVEPDTSLAEEYLKKCNYEFHTLGSTTKCDANKFALDNVNNKVFYTDEKDYEEPPLSDNAHIPEIQKSLWELAKKLEENVDLFAQLEYLIRKVPIEEVKNYDMKLLIQHMYYCSSLNKPEIDLDDQGYVAMTDDSALACLGAVARRFKLYKKIVIEASPQTAAVCTLFTQLCHDVGLNQVILKFKEPGAVLCGININIIEVIQNGGVAVVTEFSDVDSAVDTILDTPHRCPWKLRKIFVQENVYGQFQRALRWKCGLKDSLITVEESLKSRCSETFVYKQKMFLINYIDPSLDSDSEWSDKSDYDEDDVGVLERLEQKSIQAILVQTYADTEELLSFVKEQNPFFLSLWSSDYSEAHKIPFGVSVPIVWINDFGTLDGPEKVSQTFYSMVEPKLSYYTNVDMKINKKTEEAWKNMRYAKRIELFQKAIKGFKEKYGGEIEFADQLEKDILCWDFERESLEIENGKMCVVVEQPLDTKVIVTDLLWSVKTLLQGTPIIYIKGLSPKQEDNMVTFFEKEQMPIMLCDDNPSVISKPTPESVACTSGIGTKTRAMWWNFGTIFAN